MIETEVIASIDGSDFEATVITTYESPNYAFGCRTQRRRYHLKALDGNWLIWLVEHQCFICHGQGDESCVSCKGKHWT